MSKIVNLSQPSKNAKIIDLSRPSKEEQFVKTLSTVTIVAGTIAAGAGAALAYIKNNKEGK